MLASRAVDCAGPSEGHLEKTTRAAVAEAFNLHIGQDAVAATEMEVTLLSDVFGGVARPMIFNEYRRMG